MRAAVYNRYWATGGGAERFGGAIAETLSARFDTELLGHQELDRDWLGERLHLDLSRTDARVLQNSSRAIAEASTDYDLFVNVSYGSADASRALHGLYVVHFPTRFHQGTPVWPRWIGGDPPVRLEWGTGFHLRDGARGATWTDGHGQLCFSVPADVEVQAEIRFGHHRPRQLGPAKVEIRVAGQVVEALTLEAPGNPALRRLGKTVRFPIRASRVDEPVVVEIVSDSFIPAASLGGDDTRQLGVPITSVRAAAGKPRPRHWLPGAWTSPPADLGWVRSYDAVLANSAFTRSWVQRLWGVDTAVLHPPATMHKPGPKEAVILNVGRFFGAQRGHSKKQLELVEAFKRLVDAGGASNWSLHLAGGCADADRHYLEQVKQRAEGYPVEVHVNATGNELASLYGRASIYWHASGLGEDLDRHPERAEHFGITTAEAMSAGAVPVVIGIAGQLETVRHGIDGYHFRSLDGLVAMTRQLIDDDRLRANMSESSQQRALRFSPEAFARTLNELVDRLFER